MDDQARVSASRAARGERRAASGERQKRKSRSAASCSLAPALTVDQVALGASGAAALDRPPPREPLLPLGAARARRLCARFDPPVGLDAQAAYAASLRLALARWERDHRPEHLLLVLVTLDPGARWALHAAAVHTEALLGDLAAAFPPPRRNLLLRAERRLGQQSRRHDLVRRYQHTTGRTAPADSAIAALING